MHRGRGLLASSADKRQKAAEQNCGCPRPSTDAAQASGTSSPTTLSRFVPAGRHPASCAQTANLNTVMGGNRAIHPKSTLLVWARALMYAQPDAAAAAKHLLLLLSAGALPEGAPLPFCLSVGDLVTQKNLNLFTPSLHMPCFQCHRTYWGLVSEALHVLTKHSGQYGNAPCYFWQRCHFI